MRIAVAGYGVEGRSNYTYWSNIGYVVDILDENENVSNLPDDAHVVLGTDAYKDLGGYDFVVRTAGLNPNKLTTARKVWSATNEFLEKCPATVIGVTGSKGKGTTSSLIESILRMSGRTVHLVGNIGVPALDKLGEVSPGDVVVYEMSSFQLWDLERSPNIAVILHIEPDHLDVHASFVEYIEAKSKIVQFQEVSDIAIVNPVNLHSLEISSRKPGGGAGVVKFGDGSQTTDIQFSYVEGGSFRYGSGDMKGEIICSVDALQLPGSHNIDNANAAITASLQIGVDSGDISRGLESFTGLDHRLKLVGEVSGVRFYDDSIATTPGSAMAAVRSFTEPKVLIMGGSSKGADFSELAEVIASSDVRRIVLMGEEASKIRDALLGVGLDEQNIALMSIDLTMSDIVTQAFNEAQSGDVVLLSPACASFGQFINYQDRGDQFIQAVEKIGEEV